MSLACGSIVRRATFGGPVGLGTPLASITASRAGGITLGSTVRTTGPQSYASLGGISVADNITTTNSSVLFTGPVSLTPLASHSPNQKRSLVS